MYNGTYSVSGDKLIYKATMSDIDYPEESYTMELTFKKVSSEIGFEPAPVDDSLVGVWYDSDRCHRLAFLSNGCVQYLQLGDGLDTIPAFFAYSVNDGKFTCYDAEGNKFLMFGLTDVPYQVNGNKLTITGLDDGSYVSIVYTK